MAIIVPAILTDDPNVYKSEIESYNAFAKRVQFDITDGELVKRQTVALENIWWPKEWEADIHMMVIHPSQHLDTLVKLKPTRVIFHAEVDEDLLPAFQKLKQAGIKVGLALLPHTFPGAVANLIQLADHVLIFAGTLGEQGGAADMLQIEKAPLIRAIKHSVEIGWDGGASIENVRAIAHSDIDVINVGQALSQSPDPAATYKQLVDEADRRGVRL